MANAINRYSLGFYELLSKDQPLDDLTPYIVPGTHADEVPLGLAVVYSCAESGDSETVMMLAEGDYVINQGLTEIRIANRTGWFAWTRIAIDDDAEPQTAVVERAPEDAPDVPHIIVTIEGGLVTNVSAHADVVKSIGDVVVLVEDHDSMEDVEGHPLDQSNYRACELAVVGVMESGD